MVVVVLTACPVGLRGFLTRWLLEISAGVFVGVVSVRVREELWLKVVDLLKDGRALMVFADNSEQGYSFLAHQHHWEVRDLDGLTLMRRPPPGTPEKSAQRKGWSVASKRRKARK